MTIRSLSFRSSIVAIAGLLFCCGCEPASRRPASAKKTATDTSSQEAPGPQTEPESNSETSSNSAEAKIENSSVTLEVADKAGFDAVLAKHKGQIVLVDYWATWCLSCRKKFPHTVELAKAHRADGLAVISVALDDEDARGDVEEFLKKQDATFDNLLAKGGASDESFEAFGIPGGALPCLRLFDREGILVKTFAFDPESEKQFTDEELAAAVKEQLAK